jgi:hypothetical protein
VEEELATSQGLCVDIKAEAFGWFGSRCSSGEEFS